jgi:hypothetical protein
VTIAGLAPLAVAAVGFVVGSDVVFAAGHLHRRRLPEREGVKEGLISSDLPCRSGRPLPAGVAVAVAGSGRLPAYIELHRSPETAAVAGHVGTHGLSPCFVGFLASVPDGRRKFNSAA